MRLIGYARVSTQDQHLDGQIAALTNHGCTHIYREKASGSKATRPEYGKMLAAATAGDVIIVAKLDRIARSTVELLRLLTDLSERGVGFKALNIPDIDTTTATGKLMITVLGAIAEFERGMLLERQRDGITRAQAEGKYKGRVPTAQRQSDAVLAALASGATRAATATITGVSIASVYRIQRTHRLQEV